MPNFDGSVSQKTRLKKVKSSMKLQNVFRRVSRAGNDSDSTKVTKAGRLFGVTLDELCGEENTFPPAVEVRYLTLSN